jgi:imidazolonepropionase-like amidohydrolase
LSLWQRMAYIDVGARIADPRVREVPAAIRATWPKAEEEINHASQPETMKTAQRIVKQMRDCGVTILAGTDTGDPWTIPGVSLYEELRLLVEAGLTPMEALRSATALPAKYLRWDESVGLVRKGFVADFVLLSANPLVDIRNVSKVVGVSVRGQYFGPLARASMLNRK